MSRRHSFGARSSGRLVPSGVGWRGVAGGRGRGVVVPRRRGFLLGLSGGGFVGGGVGGRDGRWRRRGVARGLIPSFTFFGPVRRRVFVSLFVKVKC